MKWFFKALEKYAVFKGRARRKEYWMFILFYFIFFIAFIFLDAILGTLNQESSYGLFNTLYVLLTAIPLLAVGVRRLHDVGKKGWLVVLVFITGNISRYLYLSSQISYEDLMTQSASIEDLMTQSDSIFLATGGLSAINLIGSIVLIVFFLTKGNEGVNKYGFQPEKVAEIRKKISDITGKTKIERQCPNCYKSIIISPYKNKNVVITDNDLEKDIVRCRSCRKKIDLKNWVVKE